jgi:two-component system, NarL family, response regulator NreC
MIKIVIADDHGVLRAGLRTLLNAEPEFQVVGEASTGQEAIRLVSEFQPDIILMDITMPDMDGIQATRQLKAQFPQLRILILTIHTDTSLLREALHVGVSGYIVKQAVEIELITAIHQVAAGGLYIHPALTLELLGARQQAAAEFKEITLTSRELDVLRLLAKGYTNRQIAEELVVSIRTIETHRANMMNKLNLHSRVDLMRYAADMGIK